MRKNLKKKKVAPKKLVTSKAAIMKAKRPAQKTQVKAGISSVQFSPQRMISVCFVIIALFALMFFIGSYGNKHEKTSVLTSAEPVEEQVEVQESDDITLVLTGDVAPVRYVEEKMRRLNDYTYPFQKTADFLKNADITFGNLETPLCPGKTVPKDSMVFRADLKAVDGLLFAGFDVVSLANNHTMNYQVPCLTSTLQTLNKAGIKHAGAGKNVDVAHTPAVFEVKGKRIAFYAYVDEHIPPGFHGDAKANKPGVALMDIEEVKNDVKNALANADIVIVSMHAGKEYKHSPTQFQKDFAHAAIDAGAAVVIGHHPHVVQPVEDYNGGLIFYSLGNFVFDQFFSEDVKTGMAARITFEDGEGSPTAELFPVRIENTAQPRILEGAEREAALKKMGL